MAHPGGRPTKYKPEYCQKMIEFFSRPKEEQRVKKERINTRTGITEYEYELVPAQIPWFEDFAWEIGVSDDTIVAWAKTFPEFSSAYNRCKHLQKDFLIFNASRGNTPPATFIFTAKNVTNMRDQTHHAHDINSRSLNVTVYSPDDIAALDVAIDAVNGRDGQEPPDAVPEPEPEDGQ